MRGGDSVHVLASFESSLRRTNGLGDLNPPGLEQELTNFL